MREIGDTVRHHVVMELTVSIPIHLSSIFVFQPSSSSSFIDLQVLKPKSGCGSNHCLTATSWHLHSPHLTSLRSYCHPDLSHLPTCLTVSPCPPSLCPSSSTTSSSLSPQFLPSTQQNTPRTQSPSQSVSIGCPAQSPLSKNAEERRVHLRRLGLSL
jgi:hypothetical protein